MTFPVIQAVTTATVIYFADQEHFATPTPQADMGSSNYTSVPWPTMVDIGEPLLDQIRFVNPRLLTLPRSDAQADAAITDWSWSPTGKQLVLMGLPGKYYQIGNEGRWEVGALLVDVDSGQITPWQANAQWPTWSRDGQSIFYQAVLTDTLDFYADLYERRLNEPAGRLLVRTVGMGDAYQPSAIDTINGDLLFINVDQQPVLLPAGVRFGQVGSPSEKRYPLFLADLAHKPLPRNDQGEITPTRFALAPNGQQVVVMPLAAPFFILDLVHYTTLAEFADEWHTTGVAAWSRDSSAVAFSNQHGVFVYDLKRQQTTALITRQDVQFPVDSFWDFFAVSTWSPDSQVVLFSVGSADWWALDRHPDAHFGVFTFGALTAGTHRRPLLAQVVRTFAPDGLHAIVEQWEQRTRRSEAYLVDVQWHRMD